MKLNQTNIMLVPAMAIVLHTHTPTDPPINYSNGSIRFSIRQTKQPSHEYQSLTDPWFILINNNIFVAKLLLPNMQDL